jgi:two-component system, chemotaxis family, sensor kinase CheA
MAQDPYRYFRPEAHNLLDQFAQGILELEKNGSSAGAVQRLLRLAHTLKGAARVVRQSAIAERAHAIEDALAPFRDTTDCVARENIDAILAHLDEIGSRIVTLVPSESADGADHVTSRAEALTAGAATEVERSGAADAARDTQRLIRADMADLDAVLDGVSETHARLHGIRRSVEAIEQFEHLADLLRAQLAAPGSAERGRAANAAASKSIAEELRRKAGTLARELDSAAAQMDRELRQLRDAAEGLRLIPVDSVLMALKRTARDCARALGKQVTLETSGGDIRLDADVLGVVQGALIQIVRNAVAHGIEAESERLAASKPAAGRVTIDVSRRGPKILFTCRDDGRGIDLAAVRSAAVERGLLSPTANDLSAEALVGVLLRGGVSTSSAVTDVSGRGVGLDVVREALERLGGEVSVGIDPGRGTTFELLMPRSVTSVPALIVEAEIGGGAIALPLDGVCRILRLAAGDIACASAGASILYEEHAVPFIPLAAALDGTRWSVGRSWTAVIVAGSGRVGAIGVERLVGTARMVVRPLPDRLKASPLTVGAALDGEGNPQLILDPDALVATAHGVGAVELAPAPAKRPVLVIDDSLTTRMLEKSILESAGYEVDVASSGEEGIELARRKRFALILCDVEMPGIDGFTFVERIRSDPTLRDIPAILVTSRSAPEDRQRGRDAGAHGYIVKSEFDQAELLTMIRPMVG